MLQATIERQELWCHECGKYVQFDIDLSLDGNHVLNCPNCGHEHCRVVKDGIITDERWDSRNLVQQNIGGNTITITNTTFTSSSTFGNYQQGQYAVGNSTSTVTSTNDQASAFLYYSWMNTQVR